MIGTRMTMSVLRRRQLATGVTTLLGLTCAEAEISGGVTNSDAELIRLCAELVAFDRRFCGISRRSEPRWTGRA